MNSTTISICLAIALAPSIAAQTATDYRAQALVAAKAKSWAEAIRLYQEAIELDPQDPTTHFNLGSILLVQTKVKDALAEFRHAIAIQPNFGRAHESLGVALRRNGDDPGALEELKTTAKLMPDNPIAWCDLGLALKSNGDNKAAIEAFRQCARVEAGL